MKRICFLIICLLLSACPVMAEETKQAGRNGGFKYVGAVTIYSLLQACGIINDHDKDCPCYKRIVKDYPTVNKRRDHEVM